MQTVQEAKRMERRGLMACDAYAWAVIIKWSHSVTRAISAVSCHQR